MQLNTHTHYIPKEAVSRTQARQVSRRTAATGFHLPPNPANQYSIIDDVHAYIRRRIHVLVQILAKKKTTKIQILAACMQASVLLPSSPLLLTRSCILAAKIYGHKS